MPVSKIVKHVRTFGLFATVKKAAVELPSYLANIHRWQFRHCGCCQKSTIFLCNGPAPEFRICVRCSANERYELLSTHIREKYGTALSGMEVLELDPNSPLRHQLIHARKYVRTFYEPKTQKGSVRADGTVCEDITALTFANESFDLIVSSDVLEHVSDLRKAFSESRRVLRPGKVHIFTVPPRAGTRRRAQEEGGKIIYLEPPEYHRDPLSAEGALTFWDLGPDLGEVFGSDQLSFHFAFDPRVQDRRIVWQAERLETDRRSLISTVTNLRTRA